MKRWCCILVAAWALPLASVASHITLETKSGSSFRQGEVSVNVEITNSGDEPAMSVQVEAILGDRSLTSPLCEELPVGQTHRAVLEMGPPPAPAGIHTVILKVHYTDGRGYPFTALTSIGVVTTVPELDREPLTATLAPSPSRRRNELTLTVATSTEEPMEAHIRLVLPGELSCKKPDLDVSVPPRETQTCRFLVDNEGALPGSTYAILAVIDYTIRGQHRSVVAGGTLSIKGAQPWPRTRRTGGLIIIAVLLMAFGVIQFRRKDREALPPAEPEMKKEFPTRQLLFDLAVLGILFTFTLYFIPPKYLLLDTTTVGGDTPAHNYLASHLKDQLFHHGRLVSWAGGWWCGFPMFQFYFCLPYLLMALLDVILPFNIAFKLVSVLGILALPACAYVSARWMRLPRPGPLLLAIAMIPFLFDSGHTMWGVNIFSTLAGMIANSISFAIMLLAIGSACRDADDGRFRFRTVCLFVALIASHFFTTIIAGLALAIAPFLKPRAGVKKAMLVLAAEGGLALLLMAWWLIPLLAKQPFAAAFGADWDLRLHSPAVPLLVILTALALGGTILSFMNRDRCGALMLWMLLVSVFLLFFGSHLSPVFVNVRLWPFVFYAMLALGVVGVAHLIRKLDGASLVVGAALVGALLLGAESGPTVRSWAKWNYEGLENKPRWPVFSILVLPLDGTPGRLANDLHDDNDSLGSTRVFEAVPALIEKSILEGGIVNSALGSHYSYYIQSETSKNCAGFPEIVKPTTFNLTNATLHLELFNVKHFIARWADTKAALAQSPEWQKLQEVQGWELYELKRNNGRYVFIPEHEPMAVRTNDFIRAGLEWIYTIEALNQPFVLLNDNQPAEARWGEVLSPDRYQKYLAALKSGEQAPARARAIDRTKVVISDEDVTDNHIAFTTTGIGVPHMIKCSYFPNWRVRGAKQVYLVTPDFMLVYPEQEKVELYYGYTLSDNVGRTLSVLGLLIFVGAVGWRRYRTRRFLRREKS